MGLRFTIAAVHFLLDAETPKGIDAGFPQVVHNHQYLFHTLGTQQPDFCQVVVAITVTGIDVVQIIQ